MRTILIAAVSIASFTVALAQRGPAPPPPAPRAGAPIDLAGYWVSIVNEDWRWRMVTPQKGDYTSLPLNGEGRRAADVWDLTKDDASGNQCKAFGIGNIIRQPGRLHITWQDDTTMKIDFDAGQQTRLLYFDRSKPPSGPKTWQGHSIAQWLRPGGRGGPASTIPGGADIAGTVPGGGGVGLRGGPPASRSLLEGGSLKVMTTNFREGYLRKNGVPYSENASITEYFDRLPTYTDGSVWMVVSTVIDDPKYLAQSYTVSTHFRRELDGSKWNPSPCKTDPPGKITKK